MDPTDQIEVTEEAPETEAGATNADGSITMKLRQPIAFGKEMLDELTLRPNARAIRDMEVQIGKNGDASFFVFKPHPFALVGLKAAGHTAAAPALIDKMHPKDIWDLGWLVFGFFV